MPDDRTKAGGVFRLWCVAPNGQKRWDEELYNLWTIDQCNRILEVHYRNGSRIVQPTFGFISGSGYTSGPSIYDTAVNHPGWADFTAKGYLPGTPAVFVPFYAEFNQDSEQGRIPTLTAYNPINADGTIRGVWLGSGTNLSDANSTLHSTAVAQSNLAVKVNDTIYVNYVARLRS